MRRFASHWSSLGLWALLLSLAFVGCSTPATQVVLTIEVEDDLRGDVDELRVQVLEPSEGETFSSPAIPGMLVLTPDEDDASRVYRVNIDALANGTAVARAQFTAGYVECETRYATIRLSRECLSRDACTFEVRDPAGLSLTPTAAPLDSAVDAGMDGDDFDATPDVGDDSDIDAGPDAEEDGAPPDAEVDSDPADVMVDAELDAEADTAPDAEADVGMDTATDADAEMDATMPPGPIAPMECRPTLDGVDCDADGLEASDGFGGGSGSRGDPYLICSFEQFNSIRNHLNAHFALSTNVSLGDFIPIPGHFTGVLDGRGHAIEDFSIGAAEGSARNQSALFAQVRDNAVIENLIIRNFQIVGQHKAFVLTMHVHGGDDGAEVTIRNVRIGAGSVISERTEAGVIAGDGHHLRVSDFSVANIAVRANGTGPDRVGGLFSKTRSLTLERVILEDLSVTSMSERVGGIAGEGHDFTLEDVAIRNGSVSGTQLVGGLFGEITDENTGSGVTRTYVVNVDLVGSHDVGSVAGTLSNALMVRDSYFAATFNSSDAAGPADNCDADPLVCEGVMSVDVNTSVHYVSPSMSAASDATQHARVEDWFMNEDWAFSSPDLRLSFEAMACLVPSSVP